MKNLEQVLTLLEIFEADKLVHDMSIRYRIDEPTFLPDSIASSRPLSSATTVGRLLQKRRRKKITTKGRI